MKIVKTEEKKVFLDTLGTGTAFQFELCPDLLEWSPAKGEDVIFQRDFDLNSVFMLIEQEKEGDDAVVVDLESGLPYLIQEASKTMVKIPTVEPFLTVN